MASQKEKYLASAQKYIQKGQLDRAIRDYQQVVAADPKDIRHRQKLAELLARCDRREEAIREYETIGKYYTENSFYLKAIAVYKQIQKLDGTNIDIHLVLAELNEKQGLVGNALSEYKRVFSHYDKAGMTGQACEILEKMQAADPNNTDILLKLAETHYAAGKQELAYDEYCRAAAAVKNQGDAALHERVRNRMRMLFKDRREPSLEMLEAKVRHGSVSDAIPELERILQENTKNVQALNLLARAYRLAGDRERCSSAWQRLLAVSPEDAAARIGIIECHVDEGDVESALGLMQSHAPSLIAAASFLPLENLYVSLRNLAPHDTRILNGLKDLYAASGAETKLSDVMTNLKLLSDNAGGPLTDDDGREDEAAPGQLPGEEDSGTTEIDFSWEEEIDMSVPGEAPADSMFSGNHGEEIVLERADVDEPGGATAGIPAVSPGGDDRFSGNYGEELILDEVAVDGAEARGTEINFETYTLTREDMVVPPAVVSEPENALPSESPLEVADGNLIADSGKAELDFFASLNLNSVATFSESEASSTGTGTFSEPENAVPMAETVIPAQSDNLDSLFSLYGGGHDPSLDQEDTETHFNLGIAYKEMGLFDEAMKEFGMASVDPLRQVDCLTLLGICLREKGAPDAAENVFTAGIRKYTEDPDISLNIKYELALLYEGTGRNEEALRYYGEIFTANPRYRDTAEKIAGLHDGLEELDLSDIDELEIELQEEG